MDQVVRMRLRKWGTIRWSAEALNISKSTIFHHINAVKSGDMAERNEFCKSFLKDDKSTFDDLLDVIKCAGLNVLG